MSMQKDSGTLDRVEPEQSAEQTWQNLSQAKIHDFDLTPMNTTGQTAHDLGRVTVDGKFLARGGQRFRVQGVTYGPFTPNAEGEQFPAPGRVVADFAHMRAIGINCIRTYHVPPGWFLGLADEAGLAVLVDVPWSKHLCFLDHLELQRDARERIRAAAQRALEHPSVFACSIANEIPTDIVRWHGAARVESFLAELMDVAKQTAPDVLVTYSNYPSTEYLDVSFLDFATFNVYLHDPRVFRRYLLRLQNLVGDNPLLLGEIGMDTYSHGDEGQAAFLRGHLRESYLTGLAGAFVFAWTDDWFTGGFQIEDWAFGVTRADRTPKPAYHVLGEVFTRTPAQLLPEVSAVPRVSVIVCSYNGGSTLDQCLRSLLALDYPDYEVILVDDGSTDNTPEIAARYPTVRIIRQTNQGLSAARNVGLRASTGAIVAYTDSDCYADVDWLARLVYQLQRTGASAVGGPNMSPDDGWLAACVAASPGQPMHVLESDQVAEHIPGCNMAYRREALEAIGGFNVRYRKAGDDVDACWRLQQGDMWITFAPGAFVWHHRRQNPRAYLGQQAGYGEAEALLWFDHPDRFNLRGEGLWRGALYGASLKGLRFGKNVVYRGVFGTGLFQTLYQPGVAHWAMLPGTLEWHLIILGLAWIGLFWTPISGAVVAMLGLSVLVALLQAEQAPLDARYRGLKSRLLIAALCYVQPLVRSWVRYRTRFFPPLPKTEVPIVVSGAGLPLSGLLIVEYWDEEWRERTKLIERVVDHLNNHRWAIEIDSGWSDWDITLYCHPWTSVHVCTTQEDHGNGKRLIRVRYALRTTGHTKLIGVLCAISAVAAFYHPLFWMIALVLLYCFLIAWWQGTTLASQAIGIVDSLARDMGLVRCGSTPEQRRRPRTAIMTREDASAG